MRILFIAPFGFCRKQTVPRRMFPLAKELAERGHTVEMLIPAWDCPHEANRVEERDGVTLRFPRLGPAPHRLLDPMLIHRMTRAIEAFEPDVAHVFKAIGYAGQVLETARREAKQCVFVDADDMESEEGWGATRIWPVRRFGEEQERHAWQRAHGVTVGSLVLRAQVAFHTHWRDEIYYLPNGLYRAAEPAPVADNPPILLLYARGNDMEAKRVAKLWLAIHEQVPESQLHIVGDWEEMASLPHSHYFGWLEGEDLRSALRGAAAALFAVNDDARTRAKSPARVLDCLAEGLPVVTDGVGEYGILVGRGGWVVEREDENEIIRAAVTLLRDPECRATIGRAAWEWAKKHEWPRRVDDLLHWYVLERNS